VWLDLDITGGAKWQERVRRGIEACQSLIFVVSPASVASEACAHELADAVSLNKLIIPVVYQDVAANLMPSALADSEWVFLRDGDDPDVGMTRLLDAPEADLDWRDQHTRLAGRAREWIDSGRNNSYLLRGADLREAEAWLGQQEGHREASTREQNAYIARSRQAAGRRLSTVIGALTVGLVIAIALAIFALIQRHTAISETHVDQSRQLDSQAGATTDLQLASLMALEAYRLSPTLDAQSAILGVADNHEIGGPLTGHEGGVNGVAFSPGGKLLASASDDGTIRLWNVATHQQILPWMTGHTDRITSIAFSPDGTMLASGSYDKTIRLWSVATHREIGPPLLGHTDTVNDVVFSPDGKMLASAGADKTVRLWSVAGGREIGPPLLGHTDAVETVAFSPDGQTVAPGSVDNTIRLWDVAGHQQVGPPLGAQTGSVNGVAFSPNGRTLAAASNDGTIRLWDLASATSRSGHPSPVTRTSSSALPSARTAGYSPPAATTIRSGSGPSRSTPRSAHRSWATRTTSPASCSALTAPRWRREAGTSRFGSGAWRLSARSAHRSATRRASLPWRSATTARCWPPVTMTARSDSGTSPPTSRWTRSTLTLEA
jgi:WD40 repeat protein